MPQSVAASFRARRSSRTNFVLEVALNALSMTTCYGHCHICASSHPSARHVSQHGTRMKLVLFVKTRNATMACHGQTVRCRWPTPYTGVATALQQPDEAAHPTRWPMSFVELPPQSRPCMRRRKYRVAVQHPNFYLRRGLWCAASVSAKLVQPALASIAWGCLVCMCRCATALRSRSAGTTTWSSVECGLHMIDPLSTSGHLLCASQQWQWCSQNVCFRDTSHWLTRTE